MLLAAKVAWLPMEAIQSTFFYIYVCCYEGVSVHAHRDVGDGDGNCESRTTSSIATTLDDTSSAAAALARGEHRQSRQQQEAAAAAATGGDTSATEKNDSNRCDCK